MEVYGYHNVFKILQLAVLISKCMSPRKTDCHLWLLSVVYGECYCIFSGKYLEGLSLVAVLNRSVPSSPPPLISISNFQTAKAFSPRI